MLYEGKYSLSKRLLVESIEISDEIMISFREFLDETDKVRKGNLAEGLIRFFHQSGQGGNMNEPAVFKHFKYFTHEGEQTVNPSSNNSTFPLCDFASNEVSVENILGKKPKYSKLDKDYDGNPMEIKPGHPKIAFYSIKSSNSFKKSGAGRRGSASSLQDTDKIDSFLNKGQRGAQMAGIRPYLDAAFPNGEGYVLLGAYCISPKTNYNSRTGTGKSEATGLIIKKLGPKLWRIRKRLSSTVSFSLEDFTNASWEIVGEYQAVGRTGRMDVLVNNFGNPVIIGEKGYENREDKFLKPGSHDQMRPQDKHKSLRHDLLPGFPIR